MANLWPDTAKSAGATGYNVHRGSTVSVVFYRNIYTRKGKGTLSSSPLCGTHFTYLFAFPFPVSVSTANDGVMGRVTNKTVQRQPGSMRMVSQPYVGRTLVACTGANPMSKSDGSSDVPATSDTCNTAFKVVYECKLTRCVGVRVCYTAAVRFVSSPDKVTAVCISRQKPT